MTLFIVTLWTVGTLGTVFLLSHILDTLVGIRADLRAFEVQQHAELVAARHDREREAGTLTPIRPVSIIPQQEASNE